MVPRYWKQDGVDQQTTLRPPRALSRSRIEDHRLVLPAEPFTGSERHGPRVVVGRNTEDFNSALNDVGIRPDRIGVVDIEPSADQESTAIRGQGVVKCHSGGVYAMLGVFSLNEVTPVGRRAPGGFGSLWSLVQFWSLRAGLPIPASRTPRSLDTLDPLRDPGPAPGSPLRARRSRERAAGGAWHGLERHPSRFVTRAPDPDCPSAGTADWFRLLIRPTEVGAAGRDTPGRPRAVLRHAGDPPTRGLPPLQ